MTTSPGKLNIIGSQLADFQAQVADIIPSSTTSSALWSAAHAGRIDCISQWDGVGAVRLRSIQDRCEIGLPEVQEQQVSADGTVKWLMRFPTLAGAVECVYIPERSAAGAARGVLCVSSQVGCSLACTFCRTGTQALQRNLTAAEIVGQVLAAQRAVAALGAHSGAADWQGEQLPPISNVVFMGQGEPLYAGRSVFGATTIMTHPRGVGLARKHVTISTSGVAPLIPRIGSELGVNLALSLHAPDDETRSRIMSINKSYPLDHVLHACRQYAVSAYDSPASAASRSARQHTPKPAGDPSDPERVKQGRRIMFEYVLLAGVNDSAQHAEQLVGIAAQFNSHVNIIPFNAWQGAPYTCPSDESILAFGKQLLDAKLNVTIRWPRGRDISAACGQLASDAAAAGPATLSDSTAVQQAQLRHAVL